MSGPLEGLVVLDLTRLQPGNYATMLLGDLGADVVKVEEPGRGDYVRWVPPLVDGQSAIHHVMNRNKRSVTLNLKHPRGAELFLRLVEKADVVIESFRPGVMDRLGVGYERLSDVNPRLVYAAITGYGQDGPYRDKVGHDINYIAMAGILGSTGPADGPPVLPSVQVADLSGALVAVAGVLAALYRRASTGEGEFVDVGMMDTASSLLALAFGQWFGGGPELAPSQGLLNGGLPFYRVYECADGKHVAVGALEPQFWARLCQALGREDLIDEQYPAADRLPDVHRAMEETFRSRTRDEWLGDLFELETCVSAVNSFEEASRDPQLAHREMFVDDGQIKQLGVPVKLRTNPGSLSRAAPGLGEHNSEVYSGLGLSDEEVQGLARTGVI